MTVKAILAAAIGALAAGAAFGAPLDDAAIEFTFDDNITRGELERDIKSEMAVTASASGGPRFQLTDDDSLALAARVAATAHRHYDGLDNAVAGVALTWRHKLGLGLYAPQFALGGSASRLEYRDRWRDGWLYAAEAEAGKRLSERFAMRLAIRRERRRSDDTPARVVPFVPADVFDLDSRSVSVGAEYLWDPRHAVTVSYTRHRGDIVSTTLRNLPVFLASSAIAADNVFGAERFAYTMRAVTHVVGVGVSREVGRQASLSVGYEHRDSRGDAGIDYRSNVVRATYLHAF